MLHEIVRLCAADYEELIPFLTHSFQESRRFDRVWPALYQPLDEHMSWNLAVRRGGRIFAVVGVFPITLQVGARSLRVAGIGGVTVDPTCRRQGFMRLLMDRALDLIRAEGYELAFLGGRRHRYQHWGWEKCGLTISMSVDRYNIEHTTEGVLTDAGAAELTLEPLSGAPDVWDALQPLHDRQLVRCQRPEESFHLYLQHCDAQTHVAVDAHGKVVGYLVLDEDGTGVHELVSVDDPTALKMIRLALTGPEGKASRLSIAGLGAHRSTLIKALGPLAEGVSFGLSGNWQVFDWPAVVGALLTLQADLMPLIHGAVVIAITGQPRAMRLYVGPDEVGCQWTDDKPDVCTDAFTAMRMLFGPLPPALVITLPEAASALQAWCPMPLSIPNLDRC